MYFENGETKCIFNIFLFENRIYFYKPNTFIKVWKLKNGNHFQKMKTRNESRKYFRIPNISQVCTRISFKFEINERKTYIISFINWGFIIIIQNFEVVRSYNVCNYYIRFSWSWFGLISAAGSPSYAWYCIILPLHHIYGLTPPPRDLGQLVG